MPIEIISLGHDGTLTTTTDPGDVPASPADKTQENQIDVQKSQWQYEVDKEKNNLALLELQLKYSQQAQTPTANGVSAAEEVAS